MSKGNGTYLSLFRGKTFGFTSFVFSVFFVLFVIWFGQTSRTVAEERLTEHARVIARSIWILDVNIQKEYLVQACRFYDYQLLTVIDNADDMLLHLEYPASGFLDNLLIDSGLIPLFRLTEDVYYNEQKLGSISVIKQHKAIYIYSYVFLFLCLALTIFYLYLKIFEQKKILEAANKELEHARVKADEANKAKSIFLANMSHELRTPLNAILGFSQLMTRDISTTEAQQKNLGIINRSGEHLLAMINYILDLSKIEAGKIEIELEAFDLHQALKDIGEMIRSRAQAKSLNFQLELDDDLVRHVQTDLGKLRQILINLLGNAVKFTEEDGVILRARTTKLDNVFHLTIEVEDTGPGIPASQLESIFKPFVQAGMAKAGQKGTGLGLSITRSFVKLMGGTLSVESELGKGSVFRVEIPIKIAEAAEIAFTEVLHQQVIGLAPNQPQYRILIVEDDEENLQLLKTLLTQVGFSVQVARNGKEAVDSFQQWHPDFIWMDMRMPVMDGYEATQKIRALPDGKEVKILALTASAFKEQHEKILAAGCNDVIHKPYKDYEIFNAMARYLDVNYIYKEGVTSSVPERVTTRPSTKALARLPTELLDALQKTARSLDMSEFNKLLDDVAILDPALRDGLAALVSEFRFDEVLKLCKLANDKD